MTFAFAVRRIRCCGLFKDKNVRRENLFVGVRARERTDALFVERRDVFLEKGVARRMINRTYIYFSSGNLSR